MFGRIAGRIVVPGLAMGLAACSSGSSSNTNAATSPPTPPSALAVKIQAATDTAINSAPDLNGIGNSGLTNGAQTQADAGKFYYNSGHLEVLEAGADPAIAGDMNGASFTTAPSRTTASSHARTTPQTVLPPMPPSISPTFAAKPSARPSSPESLSSSDRSIGFQRT